MMRQTLRKIAAMKRPGLIRDALALGALFMGAWLGAWIVAALQA